MKIKTKLLLAMGALFVLIVVLGVVSVKYIRELSQATDHILAANYQSLDYSRRMLAALDRLDSDPGAWAIFEENLEKQRKNVTEIDENDVTSTLMRYSHELRSAPTGENVRRVRSALNDVMALNMASIVRKSDEAHRVSEQAAAWVFAAGGIGALIAFGLAVYIPVSIGRPLRELVGGIRQVSNRNYDQQLSLTFSKEFSDVARAFNDMAARLSEFRQSTLADILRAKKYIEAVVDGITEPIIGLDEHHTVLFANAEALAILNLQREQIIGKSAAEVGLQNDLLRRLVRELIDPAGKREPLKIYADNKESYFQAKYIPLRSNGEGTAGEHPVGDVILLKNITEFKELDSAKTMFISTVSHELKTPVAAILMSLKLLADNRVGGLNEEQQSLARSIRENSDRLLEITGELLKMTQVEAGKLQLNPKITKPVELIEYAIKANRVQSERFNCSVEVEYPEKISKLFVDSEKIAWVITNLLSNALRYTPEHGRVVIGARQDDHAVEIYVKDFGKGIDPRYQQSIFDRYFRVPGTKVQGSGLGLAISKDFVEAHGGTIRVESEMGKGSTFIVRFTV